MLRRHVRLLGLAFVMVLLFSIMVVPSVLAKKSFPGKNPIFQTQPLNDRFASNAAQAEDSFGSAKVRTIQQGELVVHWVTAKNLAPNTDYEVHVGATTPANIGFVCCPPSASAMVVVTTDDEGVLHVEKVDLGAVAAGDYRVDVLVMPTFPSKDLTNVPAPSGLKNLVDIIDRDVLLACQPAFFVTVE